MEGGELVIAPFAPADRARLEAIRLAAFAPIFASFRALLGPELAAIALADEEEVQRRHLDALCAEDGDSRVFVARLGGEIVGFVGVVLHRDRAIGEIGLNAVAPEFAGRGVGAALYAFALDRMRESGMRAACVGTGADASHAPARRAYAKAGFDRVIPDQWMYRAL